MTEVVELDHSPLGGSGAERWMNCPGSQTLLKMLDLPDDESDFAAEGSAAHAAAEHCLLNGQDTWEIVGQKFKGYTITDELALPIQVYLDTCRADMTEGVTWKVETRIGKRHDGSRPHPLYYGSVDFFAYGENRLVVTDFKFGVGIQVDPEWNAQGLYYAYGILISRPRVRDDREVVIRIVQPRGFHPAGPVREWVTTAGEVLHWGETVLLPAMAAVEFDSSFLAGKWCRFCPAKLACPALSGMFEAATKADITSLPALDAARIGRDYAMIDQVEMYIKALETEVLSRNMAGHTVPGTKLVQKKADRVFKAGAEEIFKARFGEAAFTPAKLKSPAEMEKIEPAAKTLVNEWAFKPDTGLTHALATDKGAAIKVETVTAKFAQFKDLQYAPD